MADTTTNQGAAVGGTMLGQKGIKQGMAGSDGIVVDKNKSQEQYITDAEAKYIVPAIVREKFPDLVKLIYETESMNEEEREYWLQIMPIMSEDQIVKFREILVNEKDQLAKLDTEYNQEISRIDAPKPAAQPIDEAKRLEEAAKIKAAENAQQTKETGEEEALLGQLNSL